jgi:hypothetical protein
MVEVAEESEDIRDLSVMEVYQEVFQWIAILRFKKVIEKVQNR